MPYCINFDWNTGMYDGTGNEGCIDKMTAFAMAMAAADTDGSGTITAEECYNVEDGEIAMACGMVTEWCDYDYSGDVEWCEFI